jgi:hypothetical protein
MEELIRKNKLSHTEMLSEKEQSAFLDHLLKHDYLILYYNQYEQLAFFNKESKQWIGSDYNYNARSRSK